MTALVRLQRFAWVYCRTGWAAAPCASGNLLGLRAEEPTDRAGMPAVAADSASSNGKRRVDRVAPDPLVDDRPGTTSRTVAAHELARAA